mmetsp:Transcript_31990/g.46093  ORF Transcript_31990/g.46093 Transcript_31990/m.46093 type:complete len:287 (+) Transcript_31990:1-861(+)
MKFRARIGSKENLLILLNVSTLFEKIGETCVLLLSDTSLRISLVLSDTSSVPRCYADLQCATIFNEWKIESQNENNVILFEIGLTQLSRALTSGKMSSNSQLKLVKRDNSPCLCFETNAHESSLSIDVTHDIPIKILKSSDLLYHLPPQMSSPSVALDLPHKTRLMKTIVERMAKLSKYVHMTASQTGRLVLRAEHSSAVIKTFFNGLQPRYVGELNALTSAENEATVKLNLRTLSVVMNVQTLAMENASIYITEGELVLMHVSLSPSRVGSITYYIPVLISDDGL